MTNLQVGQKITFTNDMGTFTREIHSIYVCKFNTEMIRYNTKGLNGGYGCDGFGVEPEQITKAN